MATRSCSRSPACAAWAATSLRRRIPQAGLRARNPAWGIRTLEEVVQQAGLAGLHLHERVAMPANNLLLVWGRAGSGSPP